MRRMNIVLYVLGAIGLVQVLAETGYDPADGRNAVQLGNMIQCPYEGDNSFGFIASFADYNGYGCYCGVTPDEDGINVMPVLDETDKCCQIHDDCYRALDIEETVWETTYYLGLNIYTYTCSSSGNITCTDSDTNSTDRKLCECDKAISNCFFTARDTYNETIKDEDDSTQCNSADVASNYGLGVIMALSLLLKLFISV